VPKAPRLVVLYVTDVTADSALIKLPLALVNHHLIGYVLPALPVLTVGGLSTRCRSR
jgi:hypothetical protein